MSRTQLVSIHAHYSPIKDVVHRHEGGVTKSKKIAVTGSGRAWREDEEAYLLQTRLQKMPYKHIAAHLNKTELACRLHYHQLSHGSSRRKRTPSCSSGSSDGPSYRPGLSASPTPQVSKARSLSPARAVGAYVPMAPASDVQLPSIMAATPPPPMAMDRSPRLPAILPKPEPVMAMSPHRYPAVVAEASPGSLGPHGSRSATPYQSPAPALRLDCSGQSGQWPPSATAQGPAHGPAHVDLPRLRAIYETRRNAFWAAIADEYGPYASPAALEQAWRSGVCCPQQSGYGSILVTPVSSPDGDRRRTALRSSGLDKTRISSILGVDMEPIAR